MAPWHVARACRASQYPPQPAKDCRASASAKASATETTMSEWAAHLLVLLSITFATSPKEQVLNFREACLNIQAFFRGAMTGGDPYDIRNSRPPTAKAIKSRNSLRKIGNRGTV